MDNGFQGFVTQYSFGGGILCEGIVISRIQFYSGKSAFVVDAYSSTTFHSLFNIIHVDVVAKDGLGACILLFNGCTGETNERSIGQSIAHMPGKAVDKITLTPLGFVGRHHNVSPVGELGQRIPFFFGQEFLDGCKYNTTGSNREKVAQGFAVGSLAWFLTQQLLAVAKSVEQLVVEVVAVC